MHAAPSPAPCPGRHHCTSVCSGQRLLSCFPSRRPAPPPPARANLEALARVEALGDNKRLAHVTLGLYSRAEVVHIASQACQARLLLLNKRLHGHRGEGRSAGGGGLLVTVVGVCKAAGWLLAAATACHFPADSETRPQHNVAPPHACIHQHTAPGVAATGTTAPRSMHWSARP